MRKAGEWRISGWQQLLCGMLPDEEPVYSERKLCWTRTPARAPSGGSYYVYEIGYIVTPRELNEKTQIKPFMPVIRFRYASELPVIIGIQQRLVTVSFLRPWLTKMMSEANGQNTSSTPWDHGLLRRDETRFLFSFKTSSQIRGNSQRQMKRWPPPLQSPHCHYQSKAPWRVLSASCLIKTLLLPSRETRSSSFHLNPALEGKDTKIISTISLWSHVHAWISNASNHNPGTMTGRWYAANLQQVAKFLFLQPQEAGVIVRKVWDLDWMGKPSRLVGAIKICTPLKKTWRMSTYTSFYE
jgi:hypothetical protein